MLQTKLMTWDRRVKLAPKRDCDHLLLFKQAAPDSLSHFYFCTVSVVCMDSFTSLVSKNGYHNYQLVPCFFFFTLPNSPTTSDYLFDLYLCC